MSNVMSHQQGQPVARTHTGRYVPDCKLWTGIAALVAAVTLLTEFLVRTALGPRPDLDDTKALAEFVTSTSTATLTIILCDTVLMGALIVFLAAFRQLVTRDHRELEWIGSIVFGAGLVFVAITLVGDSLEAGGALDTVGADAAPIAIRALTEGYMPIFGPMGAVLLAIVAASSGYATMASGALPRWTGWVAYVVAVLNVIAVPTIYGGTNDRDFYSVGGWGVAAFATFPWLAWVIVVGFVTIRDRRRIVETEHGVARVA
ncbi:hypothetical protein [Lacisediminihabitans changchengi]|uniref:DUF4386 family protein n=1 Tax=Lacisediminihabitans changchengi TaxID=2787634 RepID=A0A934SL23_9MICO|nr:hypothetical protein [Lacisediminihabitans changchengi]MBK4347305.1 hypothetical protein [Lacisediminihabitans changchengi]